MKILFSLKVFFILVALLSYSQEMELPENHELRAAFKELILAPIQRTSSDKRGAGRLWRQRESAHRVQYRTEINGNFLYQLFLNEKESSFPIAGAGNYIIKRDRRNGRFIQIKVFIRSHPDCFIRIFPMEQGERSIMDVILFGVPLYRQVILPADFFSLLTATFSKIRDMSSPTVNWPLLFYSGERETDLKIEKLLETIRGYLPGLVDAEDGAIDAEGNFVFISNGSLQGSGGGLNCSGFSKWIVDGFIFALENQILDIERLKVKHLEYRGHRWSARYEQERDPYFGLDWSRNLAISLQEAESGITISDPEHNDVRNVPFLRYIEDVGYPVAELELLLYLESRINPGSFYIGSLNRQFGSKPVLQQHFHLVVLFPYFSEDGTFQVAVLERNQATSLASLTQRFKDNHIHLVRLNSRIEFIPQQLKKRLR